MTLAKLAFHLCWALILSLVGQKLFYNLKTAPSRNAFWERVCLKQFPGRLGLRAGPPVMWLGLRRSGGVPPADSTAPGAGPPAAPSASRGLRDWPLCVLARMRLCMLTAVSPVVRSASRGVLQIITILISNVNTVTVVQREINDLQTAPYILRK